MSVDVFPLKSPFSTGDLDFYLIQGTLAPHTTAPNGKSIGPAVLYSVPACLTRDDHATRDVCRKKPHPLVACGRCDLKQLEHHSAHRRNHATHKPQSRGKNGGNGIRKECKKEYKKGKKKRRENEVRWATWRETRSENRKESGALKE